MSRNIYNIERSSVPHSFEKELYYKYFSLKNIDYISSEITNRLKGVHPENKNIIVPESTIISVMDSMYYSTFRDFDKMTIMTINYIVEYITNEFAITKNNSSLNIWSINNVSEFDMDRVSKIKMREKRPSSFVFNMNY